MTTDERGSPITRGHVLASSHDKEHLRFLLRFRLPAEDQYYVTVIDANDRGGACHLYQLSVRLER